MRGWALPVEPLGALRDITTQDRRWVPHVDAERFVDGRMADPETEDEAPTGRVRDKRGALRTDVGMTQIDVGDPCPHCDALSRDAHKLRGRHYVVVHLGREDRVEPRVLSLARDCLYLR